MTEAVDFLVNRTDLTDCRFAEVAPAEEAPLEEGEILLGVELFALTANNLTYAVLGDSLGYWRFFPAPPGWGRLPVWGVGHVMRSRHPGIDEGERLYGYLPMSSWVVLRPGTVTPTALVDASTHRVEFPRIYNSYRRVSADPMWAAGTPAQQVLLRPLFGTGYLLADHLAHHDAFTSVIVTSASSKTAICLASLLDDKPVTALTSPSHVEFLEALGRYANVVTYASLESIDPTAPAALVDLAGDAALLHRVHEHFGDALRLSCLVGATHWASPGWPFATPADLPGPKPTPFSAPEHAASRTRELGADVLDERIAHAWRGFAAWAGNWLRVVEGQGPIDVERRYREILAGAAEPVQGHVLSLLSAARD
jgi:hypothetical protein